jgi:uncharacterized protein (DUF1786 family)
MARLLAIDVGAGTLDALFLDTATGDQFKFVAKSPTRVLGEKIGTCTAKTILITGRQMGGGPVTAAIKAKAREARILMTRSAAGTIHHRRGRIERLGVTLISEREALREATKRKTAYFKTGDIVAENIKSMLTSMGLEPVIDYLGVAVQDHGTSEKPVSSLDFRHHIFRQIIEQSPKPSSFLFEASEIPPFLRRLRAAAMDGRRISEGRVYVMDTGMAAILGASSDPETRGRNPIIVLDVATSHTLGALLVDAEIGGFFEYHTSAVTPKLLRSLVIDLAEGRLSHETVVAQGGHGAYIREAVGFDRIELVLATGPKREILDGIGLEKMRLGAPFGDNMMTGASGLMLAMAEREGLSLQR